MAVKPKKPARPKMNLAGLKRARLYLGHYPRIMVVAYGSLILATLAQLVVPTLVRNIIDTVTNGVIAQKILSAPAAFQPQIEKALNYSHQQVMDYGTDTSSKLIIASLLMVGFAVIKGIFTFLQNYNGERLSQSVAYDLRNDLFAKIQRLSFSYHDKNQTGQLMIRATDDVEKVRLFLGQGLIMTVSAIVLLVGALIILFVTNFALTLVVLPILPIAMVVFFIFGAVSQPLFFKVQVKLSALNTILQENMAGIKVVKAFSREQDQQVKFEQAATDLVKQQLMISRVFTFLFPLIFLISNLGQAVVLYAGGAQIINATLTLGEWQQFSLYLAFIFFPMAQLGMIITQMAQASASANRIFEILDAQSDVVDKPGAQSIPAIVGHVEFKNVSFSYPGSTTPVLSNVSFEAKPGQTVALLGATGSGKTSIINLVPRFYDPTQGQVLIDGHDLRDLTIDSLRRQIGIVLQETNLFTGTIRDNIAFGRTNATQAQVEAAAKAAAAHDFIITFPQGYDTSVGELGSTLSGGQKQRIAIARALLLDPRILILDDSTSSVDLVTEYKIQKALDQLMLNRTSLVIAQRISTVLNADLILVLEKGSIVARGTHEELMEESEIYAQIYQSQLVEDVNLDHEAATAMIGQEA
ncbi:MAG: ABC transporter ATP-binding protein [Chloroflexi bacterium]|nr:ABC transporter ATP-binding protein [Chloroflexota bacterium]OJV97807.1 MAG: ABC transporter ATP-binding protein [Chloroflexi bacterium 54-19]